MAQSQNLILYKKRIYKIKSKKLRGKNKREEKDNHYNTNALFKLT